MLTPFFVTYLKCESKKMAAFVRYTKLNNGLRNFKSKTCFMQRRGKNNECMSAKIFAHEFKTKSKHNGAKLLIEN